MRHKLIFVLVLLTMCSVAEAQRARARRIRPAPSHGGVQTCTGTTYYVRTDGNNANTGTANTAGGAWRTIAKAAGGTGATAAGSCVRVQAGTYNETVTFSNSGTSGNTITFVADGSVTTCGGSFASKSYVRLIGFTLDPSSGTCAGSPSPVINLTGTNTGLEFWNNDLGNLAGSGLGTFGTSDRCNQCIVIGGGYHDFTSVGGGHVGIQMQGDDTFIAYGNFYNICYRGIDPSGLRGRYINDNFSGMIACASYHPDFFYINGAGCCGNTSGYSTSVVEAMFAQGTPTSADNKIFHAENQSGQLWADDIWRFNVIYNTGSASSFSMYSDTGGNTLTGWKSYNNDHLYGDRAVTGASHKACGNTQNNGGGALTYWVYNSIFYQCWADSETSGLSGWETTNPTADYNLGFDPDGAVTFTANWNGQAHEQSNVDPLLNNIGTLDFTLQAGSGNGANARGTGGPLTTATSCSGTTLNVAANTGSFFIADNSSNLAQYGGKLVPGDTITVNSAQYTVSSISTDALTLTASISCANGDAVYYGTTSIIDIGAYPYKAGGYTLSATKSCATGLCTITPNDSSLVRFVVCYEAGVPYSVVNASPYTCANPTGTFEARVYPRYASTTLWAVAQ